MTADAERLLAAAYRLAARIAQRVRDQVQPSDPTGHEHDKEPAQDAG